MGKDLCAWIVVSEKQARSQASTSGIQTDNGYNNDDIFNMFTQEDQYYELREPIPESHLVQQNDSDVITAAPSVELSGGIVEQHLCYVEDNYGLGHNLFSVGQFCDSDLEVAFKRNTCFIRNLKGVYLLKGNQTSNLYTINLHDMAFASRIFLMARATSTKSSDLLVIVEAICSDEAMFCVDEGEWMKSDGGLRAIGWGIYVKSDGISAYYVGLIAYSAFEFFWFALLILIYGCDMRYAWVDIGDQVIRRKNSLGPVFDMNQLKTRLTCALIGTVSICVEKHMEPVMSKRLLINCRVAYMDSLDDFAKKYKYTGIYDSSTVYDEVNKYLNSMKKFHNDGIGERVMNQVKANNRKEQKIGGFDSEMEHHNVINIMRLLQDDDMEEIQVANMVGLQTVRELEDEFVKKFCMTILKLQEIVNDYDQNKKKKKKQQQPIRSLSKKESKHVTWSKQLKALWLMGCACCESTKPLQSNPSLLFVLTSSQPLKGFVGLSVLPGERVIGAMGRWEVGWEM
ncbi:hypothetical protein Tco_0733683 [Tanacetum coccineum]